MANSGRGERVVLISNWTKVLDLLGGMCRLKGWENVLRLDGSTSLAARQTIVDEFNHKPCKGKSKFMVLMCSVVEAWLPADAYRLVSDVPRPARFARPDRALPRERYFFNL